ncbi:MAG: nucleoside deaminase [Patescibacteria group bacterium]
MRARSRRFMDFAIAEAKLGLEEEGIPIGAVLARDGRVIGRGHNRRIQHGNPILHAEIDCLRDAGRIGNYRGTVLYSTLMPCFLCAGAVVQFGIKVVVVGESKTLSGTLEFLESHGVRVLDLDLKKPRKMMEKFIKENPELWNEDIGRL